MTDQELKDLVANLAVDNKETDRLIKETDRIVKETSLQMQETDRRMQETDRIVKENALQMHETERILNEKFAETDRMMKENARKSEEFDKKFWEMHKEIGGISNSNGDFAEEFFYNSLKETMTFAGIHYEYISDKFARQKKMPDKTEVRAQFDIVLHNGNSIALIEAKYKADLEDVKELVEKKIPNFRFLYPEFANYKLYLGIGSLVLKDRIVQEAKKLGIGLMMQKGDAVEYKTDWVRAY
jgi:exonuclease VII large subunit